jgi:DNA-binding transcriptional regulator YiaG
MTENNYIGPPQMVKIDGSRVRIIRESKGLTQLYIATVVGVTTDTISRWENRRYLMKSLKQKSHLVIQQMRPQGLLHRSTDQ